MVDTSALLAILFDEPEADAIEGAIEADPVRIVSAASLVEAAMVIECRLGAADSRELNLLVKRAGIFVSVVDEE